MATTSLPARYPQSTMDDIRALAVLPFCKHLPWPSCAPEFCEEIWHDLHKFLVMMNIDRICKIFQSQDTHRKLLCNNVRDTLGFVRL